MSEPLGDDVHRGIVLHTDTRRLTLFPRQYGPPHAVALIIAPDRSLTLLCTPLGIRPAGEHERPPMASCWRVGAWPDDASGHPAADPLNQAYWESGSAHRTYWPAGGVRGEPALLSAARIAQQAWDELWERARPHLDDAALRFAAQSGGDARAYNAFLSSPRLRRLHERLPVVAAVLGADSTLDSHALESLLALPADEILSSLYGSDGLARRSVGGLTRCLPVPGRVHRMDVGDGEAAAAFLHRPGAARPPRSIWRTEAVRSWLSGMQPDEPHGWSAVGNAEVGRCAAVIARHGNADVLRATTEPAAWALINIACAHPVSVTGSLLVNSETAPIAAAVLRNPSSALAAARRYLPAQHWRRTDEAAMLRFVVGEAAHYVRSAHATARNRHTRFAVAASFPALAAASNRWAQRFRDQEAERARETLRKENVAYSVSPLHDREYDGLHFRQLLSAHDLAGEALAMSHCVGMYASSCAGREMMVFASVDSRTGERATLGLDSNYDIMQLTLRRDLPPSAALGCRVDRALGAIGPFESYKPGVTTVRSMAVIE